MTFPDGPAKIDQFGHMVYDWEQPIKPTDDGFQFFWESLINHETGLLIPIKVKNELHDYWIILGNVAKVYDHITGGRISKPNTESDVVISVADEHYEDLYNGEKG